MDPDKYRRNVAELDVLIAQFLQVHSLKMKHKHFAEGISPIVKTAISGAAANRDSSTGGLGGVDHQFIPNLLLQILLCIGTTGDILPNLSKWNTDFNNKLKFPIQDIGNITEIVHSSGFLVFDLYKTLERSHFSFSQIMYLQQTVKTLQVHMHRLFALKQLLCNSNKPYKGIKLHIIKHIIDGIVLYGCPHVFDMIRFDVFYLYVYAVCVYVTNIIICIYIVIYE